MYQDFPPAATVVCGMTHDAAWRLIDTQHHPGTLCAPNEFTETPQLPESCREAFTVPKLVDTKELRSVAEYVTMPEIAIMFFRVPLFYS